MAEYTKTVPKDPAGGDETLQAVLGVIIFMTADGDEFARYQITRDKVILTFEAAG